MEAEIITKDELDSLNLPEDIANKLREILKESDNKKDEQKKLILNNIQDLNKLINFLIEQLLSVMTLKKKKSKDSKDSYSYSFEKQSQDTFKKITLLSAALVFKMRRYFLNEELMFSFGVINEEQQLFERRISSTELFKLTNRKIRSSLSKKQKGIMAIGALENLAKNELNNINGIEKNNNNKHNSDLFQYSNFSLWSDIQKVAYGSKKDDFYTTKTDSEANYEERKKDGKDYIYFGKKKRDINVYARYSQSKKEKKKTIITYYYLKSNKNLDLFNNGWLFEWYTKYIRGENGESNFKQLETDLKDTSNTTPLKNMMDQMDAIPGYKGGDYIDYLTGGKESPIQTQAKFGNPKLISFTSIITVLREMKRILEEYFNEEYSNKEYSNKEQKLEQASKEIFNLFTDQTTLAKVNKKVDEKVEKTLEGIYQTTIKENLSHLF